MISIADWRLIYGQLCTANESLVNIHFDQDIDVDAAIEIFAQNHRRLLLFADLLSTDLELRSES